MTRDKGMPRVFILLAACASLGFAQQYRFPQPARVPPRPAPQRSAPVPLRQIAPAPVPLRQFPAVAPAPIQQAAPAPAWRVAPAPAPAPVRQITSWPATVTPFPVFSRDVRVRSFRPGVVAWTPKGFGAPPVAMALREQRSILGPAPSPGLVFIPGYYSWSGGFVWIDPVWIAPPVVGAIWVEPYWTFDGATTEWAMQEGYWQSPDTDDHDATPDYR